MGGSRSRANLLDVHRSRVERANSERVSCDGRPVLGSRRGQGCRERVHRLFRCQGAEHDLNVSVLTLWTPRRTASGRYASLTTGGRKALMRDRSVALLSYPARASRSQSTRMLSISTFQRSVETGISVSSILKSERPSSSVQRDITARTDRFSSGSP